MKKKLLFKLDNDCSIYEVDGGYVRDFIDIEFCLGGHHYRYPFIPKAEIWVEETSSRDKLDVLADILHEVVEREWMTEGDLSYDKAHEKASAMEKKFRESYAKLRA